MTYLYVLWGLTIHTCQQISHESKYWWLKLVWHISEDSRNLEKMKILKLKCLSTWLLLVLVVIDMICIKTLCVINHVQILPRVATDHISSTLRFRFLEFFWSFWWRNIRLRGLGLLAFFRWPAPRFQLDVLHPHVLPHVYHMFSYGKSPFWMRKIHNKMVIFTIW